MTHESTRLEFAYMEENSSGSNGSIACYKSVSIMLEKFIQTCQHYDIDSKHVYTWRGKQPEKITVIFALSISEIM